MLEGTQPLMRTLNKQQQPAEAGIHFTVNVLAPNRSVSPQESNRTTHIISPALSSKRYIFP
jgi:hypothetical protein